MRIEIVGVPDCPGVPVTEQRLHEALAATGLAGTPVVLRVITSQAEAEGAGFTGSPTVLVDGRDPFALPGAVPAYTCRMYTTPDGPSGAPATADLVAALTEASRTRQ